MSELQHTTIMAAVAKKVVNGLSHNKMNFAVHWKEKLHGLSLQVNYTNRATSACQQS
jgi:hypothetical protein